MLRAITVSQAGRPRLVHTLPTPRRHSRPGMKVATRRAIRARADRAALSRLKMLHLPTYNALLADELAAQGRVPTKAQPLDIYIRQLASRRIAAMYRRMTGDDVG